jgi:ankyrin repeat protein
MWGDCAAFAASKPIEGFSVPKKEQPANENAEKTKLTDEEFLELCEEGAYQEIEAAIKNGANVNATGNDGYTALMVAALYSENPEAIRILIENGADVNAANNYGNTALILALAGWKNSNPEVIRILIENEADVNAVNNYGNTALILAGWKNSNPEVIKILIENGADVNMIGEDGMTALLTSLISDEPSLQTVTLLIENGADANAKDDEGKTALDYAKLKYSEDSEIVTVLRKVTSVSGTAPAAGSRKVNPQYSATANAWATKICNDLRNLQREAMTYFIDNNKWPTQAEVHVVLDSPFLDPKLVGARQTLYKKVLISEEVKDWDGKMRAYIGIELFEDQQGTPAQDIKIVLALKAEDYGIYNGVPAEGEMPSPYVDSDVVWMMMN